jgi:hypothetical protein
MKIPGSISKIPQPSPVVDLHSLARQIAPDDPHDAVVAQFAPPDQRPDPTVEQVLRFADLPTKELDDIISAAELEIAALKADAQIIRDAYTKHTARVAEDVKRLREEVKLSMELMRSLRSQCGLIDANAEAASE